MSARNVQVFFQGQSRMLILICMHTWETDMMESQSWVTLTASESCQTGGQSWVLSRELAEPQMVSCTLLCGPFLLSHSLSKDSHLP